MGRVVLLAAGIAVLLFLVGTAAASPEARLNIEMGLTWAQRAAGALVAIVALFAMLLQGLVAAPTLERVSPFAFAFLGALLLINQHWSLVLAFALLCLAVLIKGVFVRPRGVVAPVTPAETRDVSP